MSAASAVCIAALCWGSSVKYGKFESEKPMSMPLLACSFMVFLFYFLKMKKENYKTDRGIDMTMTQVQNEICYRKSVIILERLLLEGLITEEQFILIDELNAAAFPPILKELSDSPMDV